MQMLDFIPDSPGYKGELKTTIVRSFVHLALLILFIVAIFAGALAFSSLGGCATSPLTPIHMAANITASSANAAEKMAVDAYAIEEQVALQSYESLEARKAAIAGVRAKWLPVWTSIAAFRGAYNAFAIALNIAETTVDKAPDLAAVQDAYKKLQEAWNDLQPLLRAFGVKDFTPDAGSH